ncbi:hypothetical protein Z517_08445 [Fonsecaea pedrosoi CBS 271.37]|uniref:BZIP domain-containing protein n=1 Tax=Fonsecaea pedrosoi CBS 271.37 TaxID=1442368 RepID=A0A0D2EWN8_9EURO|nr:uncharacterized protein Z517_08445 [Fonsecaea pedrosoi CBS 271.37]KIW78607.1 hypothetical protein Z517_08445 [Fonsecaea pedrosoi CBS 271.37]
MASEASTAPGGKRSKQERIRDNQRRSRARRQEYMAGLERRLKEYQVSCRAAELQRAAFDDLQVENARLRDLLHYVGISPDIVETFGRHEMQSLPGNAPALAYRQLKPRYHQPDTLQAGEVHVAESITSRESESESSCPMFPSSASFCTPTPALAPDPLQDYEAQQCPPFAAASNVQTTNQPELASIAPQASQYEWMFRSDGLNNPPFSPEAFRCDGFAVPPNGSIPPENTNTMQCLIAKGMIEQYDPTPTEMEEINTRLTTDIGLPKFPDSGCRMNTQAVLQILQELDTRPKHD